MDDLVAQEEKNGLTQTLDPDTLQRAQASITDTDNLAYLGEVAPPQDLCNKVKFLPGIMPLMLTIQTQMLLKSDNEYPFHIAVDVYDFNQGFGPSPPLVISVIMNACQAISTIGSPSSKRLLTVIDSQ